MSSSWVRVLASIHDPQIRQAAGKAEYKMIEREEEQNWDLVQEAVRRNLVAGEREVFRRKQVHFCLYITVLTTPDANASCTLQPTRSSPYTHSPGPTPHATHCRSK